MSTYVMSDIHGQYEAFLKMLALIDLKEEGAYAAMFAV